MPTSNEPSSRACTDIWGMPRESVRRDHSVYVLCSDGKSFHYGVSKLIETKVFCCFIDIEIFMDIGTVMNDTLYDLPFADEEIA